MHRPDHSTKDPDHDGLGHAGYTEGNPGLGVPRTVVTKDQANEWSEGLARLVESSGAALVKNDFNQITNAVAWQAGSRSTGPNLLINGGFDIWQMGTSFSFDSTSQASKYTADQWFAKIGNIGVLGSGTISKVALAVGAGAAARSKINALQFAVSIGAVPSAPFIEQRLEVLEEIDGIPITFQVRGKVAASTLTVTPYVRQNFGSGGSSEVVTTGTPWTWDTTLKFWTCTITVPSISGKTIGADAFTAIGWSFPTATTFTATMAAAAAETGTVASEFPLIDPATDLKRAQRFLYKSYDDDVNPGATTAAGQVTGENSGTDAADINVDFPVPMRKVPAITWYSPGSGTVDKIERAIGAGDRTVTSTVGTGKRRSGYPVTSSPGASVLAAAHLVADARF